VAKFSIPLHLLRKERDNERRLKALYRKSCDELKAQVEQLCAERGALEHAFYQATLRIRELEQKFDAADTHPIDGLSAGDERAVQLPRNLQLVK